MIDVARLLQAVNGGDVGMIERRQHARFLAETRQPIGVIRKGRRQDLDRDITTQAGIVRAIDLAHPTGAERRDDFVRSKASARAATV